jgi:Flp pilus assembly CpaE family ATPase
VRSIGVTVAHPDPGIVDEVIHAIESGDDLYLALDVSRAAVVLASAEALEALATGRLASGPAVVGLATNADLAEVSRRALRCRAQQIVCWPHDRPALREILRDAVSHARVDPGPADGRVIAVAGARGGAGTTTVAAMLARALDATIVDADHIGAGQGGFLPEDAEPTLGSVLAAVDDLDAAALEAAFTPHASGVALCRAADSPVPSPAQVARLIELVRKACRVSVFDAGRAGDGAAREVMRLADERVVVCAADVASMRGARSLLERGGRVVVNRHWSGRVSSREATRVLGRAPSLVVPGDRRVRRAGEAGRLPRRGAARRAIDGFAAELLHEGSDGS